MPGVASFAQNQGSQEEDKESATGRHDMVSSTEVTEGFLNKRKNLLTSSLNVQSRRMRTLTQEILIIITKASFQLASTH